MATRGRPRAVSPAPDVETLDLDIDSVSVDGDGIARAGRATVLVPFTIPGERVRVRIRSRAGSGALRGALVSVLSPSPHRVVARCPHFGPGELACGGCSWQHIAYPEQLRLKTALVDRLVRERVPGAPRTKPMLTASIDVPWGFRQKVHFVFDEQRDRRSASLLMGHYARGSRRLVSVRECPVHDERGNAVAFALHRELQHAGVRAAGGRDGTLKSVAIRTAVGTSESSATLVVASEGDRRLRSATRKAMSASPDTSFHLNIHERDDGFIFGARTRTLSGSERLRESLCDTSYLMTPTSFFQTNAAAAELLVSHVLGILPSPPARVLDLYAGAGLFSIPMARAGHTVLAVESNRQSVADGIASARLNGLTSAQCRFVVSRVDDALGRAGLGAEVAVLDPPREGCGRRVVDRLFGRIRPSLAVYVSCDPQSLAADLAGIVASGYRIQSLQPIDMFPHTAHIETIAVLTR